MTDSDNPKIIDSPLSMKVLIDGVKVEVRIYTIDPTKGWALELVDEDWNSTVWEELFPTDQAAMDEFVRGVEELGIHRLLEGADTLH